MSKLKVYCSLKQTGYLIRIYCSNSPRLCGELLSSRLDEVYSLNKGQHEKVLAHIQQIANIVAHIICERKTLIGRLEAIADLTSI